MRKLIFVAFIISVSAAVIGGMFWYVPQKIEKAVLDSITELGFETVTVESIDKSTGKIIFKNIALDKDAFSRIDQIIIEYAPFDSLFNSHKAQTISVINLHLTGEYNGTNGLKIDGWENNNLILSSLIKIPTKKLKIEKSDIDLLTSTFGGLKLQYDGEIEHTDDNNIKISGLVESRQKRLSFRSRLKGTMSNEGTLDIAAKTTQVQIETDDLSINRTNGEINLTILRNSPPRLSLEASAGSIIWQSLPMGEINMTLNLQDGAIMLHTQGQTIGQEKIEFTTSLTKDGENTAYDISLHPKKFVDITAFCMRHKFLSEETVLPDLLVRMREPTLTLDTKDSGKNITFTLAGRDDHFKITGKTTLDPQTKKVTGRFEMPDTIIDQSATDIFTAIGRKKDASLAPSEFPPNEPLEEEAADDTENTQLQNSITAKLSGSISATLEDKMLKNLAWQYDAGIKEGTLHIGPVALKGMTGNFSESYPTSKETTKEAKNNEASFYIDLKNDIKQNGTIVFSPEVLSTNSPSIEELQLSVYGGFLEVETPLPFKRNRLPGETTLQVSDINLKSLFHDIGLNGVQMSGKMGGRLPLTLENGKINVSDGILQSQGSGILKISEDITANIFSGDNEQMKTIRKALKNYHYEYFEVRLDGELSDRVLMSLTANGYNPGYLNKRPIELSLQVETQLFLLLKNLLPEE